MKTKIFNALKQEYSSLGLGDEFLQAHAEALANLGLVTDENMKGVIDAQKTFLEGIQKSNDKRVTDAVTKANAKSAADKAEAEKAAKAKEAELQKQIDELKKQIKPDDPTPPTPPAPPAEDEFDKKYAAASAAQAAALKEMQDQLKAMREEGDASKAAIKKLEDEKAAWEREKAKAERSAKILAKAKELNIPQSRIDEGFVIADDADDAAIETYLTKVAGNIKNNSLPTNPHFNIRTDQEVSKEDADKIAEKIMG